MKHFISLKCFNSIYCLCTKMCSRQKKLKKKKSSVSPIQQKSFHIDLCVCLSQRCLCTIPGSRHETPPTLFQMAFSFPQAFSSYWLLPQCLMLKNDSLMNSHFRNILFVTFFLTQCTLYSPSVLCICLVPK